MISERKLQRFQLGLLLAAGALFAFYWFAYRSLSTEVRDLDKPTADAWKRLIASAQTNRNVRALDETVLQTSIEQMREATRLLQDAGQQASDRIGLDAETQTRLAEEFQLLEFDNRRLQISADLARLAATKKVQLTEPALKGLPEFDPELTTPSLHWAQLAFANQLLIAALAAEPRAVSNLSMLPILTHTPADTSRVLHEFPMRLELVGSPASVMQFLNTLPFREGEANAAGVVEVTGKTLPLFADRLILKNSSTTPTECSVEIVVSGFCESPKSETVKP